MSYGDVFYAEDEPVFIAPRRSYGPGMYHGFGAPSAAEPVIALALMATVFSIPASVGAYAFMRQADEPHLWRALVGGAVGTMLAGVLMTTWGKWP
jgi:hypothetical protein